MPIWFPWAPYNQQEKMPKIKKKYKGRVCCQHCGILNKTLKKLNSKYYFCSDCLAEVH